jgi:hypothetical protein
MYSNPRRRFDSVRFCSGVNAQNSGVPLFVERERSSESQIAKLEHLMEQQVSEKAGVTRANAT